MAAPSTRNPESIGGASQLWARRRSDRAKARPRGGPARHRAGVGEVAFLGPNAGLIGSARVACPVVHPGARARSCGARAQHRGHGGLLRAARRRAPPARQDPQIGRGGAPPARGRRDRHLGRHDRRGRAPDRRRHRQSADHLAAGHARQARAPAGAARSRRRADGRGRQRAGRRRSRRGRRRRRSSARRAGRPRGRPPAHRLHQHRAGPCGRAPDRRLEQPVVRRRAGLRRASPAHPGDRRTPASGTRSSTRGWARWWRACGPTAWRRG